MCGLTNVRAFSLEHLLHRNMSVSSVSSNVSVIFSHGTTVPIPGEDFGDLEPVYTAPNARSGCREANREDNLGVVELRTE